MGKKSHVTDKVRVKPVDWKRMFKLLLVGSGSIIGFLALIVTVFSIEIKVSSLQFFSNGNPTWSLVVICGLIVFIGLYTVFSQQLFAYHVEINDLNSKIENLEDVIKEAEARKNTDLITGIPNEEKLKIDMKSYFNRASEPREAQLVMIDLVGFKKINEKYGFIFGDEVLRYIAQRIYCDMRRSEAMYRYFHDQSNDPLWTKFYRKYPGGDEFLFLLEGDMADAMGFVVYRLNNIFKELTDLSNEKLGVLIDFKFHCAMVTIDSSHDYSNAIRKISDIFKRLNVCGKPSLAWFPENYFENIEHNENAINLLNRAGEIFYIANMQQKISSEY